MRTLIKLSIATSCLAGSAFLAGHLAFRAVPNAYVSGFSALLGAWAGYWVYRYLFPRVQGDATKSEPAK